MGCDDIACRFGNGFGTGHLDGTWGKRSGYYAA